MRAPSFNIPGILGLRNRLLDEVCAAHFNCSLEGAELEAFVSRLRRILPGGISRDVLFESARQLAGIELTPNRALRFCWQLAGNLPRLRAGRAVVEWHNQEQDEWVPLQVIAADIRRNRKDEIGYELRFRVLAGTPCPLVLIRFWSKRFCYLLGRRVGFTAPRQNMPFTDGRQFVNLRLLGRIEAAKSSPQPTFFEVNCPPSCFDYNRALLRKRMHLEPCPNGWRHPCHRCAVGYLECPAATHEQTYEERFCEGCSKPAAFDPGATTPHCVSCTERENLRRKDT